jgi:hypothetical protein
VVCILLFINLIDRVGKSLPPVSGLTRVGIKGQDVIREVYPDPVTGTVEGKSQIRAEDRHVLEEAGITFLASPRR